MKQSWSDKLFFKVNTFVGTHPRLDRIMRFCSHDLLYILVFVAFLWATTGLFDESPAALNTYLKLLMTAGVFGFVTSWSIGILFPHKRPFIQHPRIKRLLEPFGTWKSFPSDHTIASFTIAEITWLMGAPLFLGIALMTIAFFVSIARVYVGVHYPRDIVGGIIVATFFSFSSFWLLEYITQPIYSYLIRLI